MEGLKGAGHELASASKQPPPATPTRSLQVGAVVFLGGTDGKKVLLLAAVTKDLAKKVHAGSLIKEIAPMVGGGGGGRPDFAQAGGRDPSRLDEALERVYELVGA